MGKNNIEKSSLTYEELMNSHFMRHPTHSKLVHSIFNPFLIAGIILVSTITYAKVIDGDWILAIMIGMICSLFLSMKMGLVGMMMSGHGVGLVKKGKLSVLGLPSAAVVLYSIVLGLILMIVIISYTSASGSDFKRVQIFGTSMLFGFCMSILSWRFHTYFNTWYGSEYDARMEFKNKGFSENKIEESLKKLKEIGILF